MVRVLLSSLILGAVSAARLAAACPCMIQFGVCDEVQQSDAVFVGTVESVAPPFLDPFARARAPIASGEISRLQADPSPDAFESLKKIYLQMFQGVPDYDLARIASAGTPHDLQTAFEEVQAEGRYARFRVRTIYKRSDDDDDKKASPPVTATSKDGQAGKSGKADQDDDRPDVPEFLDIWTGNGDCGFEFHPGETYLVYATEDEDSGRLETSVCMRTRRLSDEDGDLSYLYFLLNAEKESARLEGFVSSSFSDQNVPRYENSISAPSPGVLLELDTGAGLRYAQSDAEGRFSFDGLKAGDYLLSLLNAGFPRTPREVVLSRRVHMDQGGCSRQILVVPQQPPTQISR